MATKFVVDAHALIWLFEGNPKLGIAARLVLEDPASELFLPAIALAEALWAVEHNRTVIASATEVIKRVRDDSRISVVPLDLAIVEISTTLAAIGEMHDRQIVATAMAIAATGETVRLLTRDPNILAADLVKVVW